jgi:hypothetical protein
MSTLSEAYAKMLGCLEKDAFEAEVCARLAMFISDFQRIPRKPQGDGGLDGLSHGQTTAYCCYGPEQEPFQTNGKGLKDDIVEKFRGDLRKLFELEHKGKAKLVKKLNVEMPTIMAPGHKIKLFRLVVSWFESHRVVGPLNASLDTYKCASDCTYVEQAAQLTVWGPHDLSTQCAVDEHTLFRVEQQALINKVQGALKDGTLAPRTLEFESKFDDLCVRRPEGKRAIEELRSYFRASWGAALALDNELAASSVRMHRLLEEARIQAAVSARLKSATGLGPEELIEKMREIMVERFVELFGKDGLGPLTRRVADGEVGRLIGDCPVEWRQNGA